MKTLLSLFGMLLLFCNPGVLDAQDAAEKKPLKVFILVGQSNMQGHARIHTLEHVGIREETKSIFEMLANADGTPKVIEDVWINSLSSDTVRKGKLTAGYGADENKIGPELAFGAAMQPLVGEPILIIKTAWGGKSLHTDFRPPSAGEFVFSDQQIERFRNQKKDIDSIRKQKKQDTGKHYRLMLEHVDAVLNDISTTYPDYDTEAGFQLSGMVWFQGWNDMVDSGVYPQRDQRNGFAQYSNLLAHFIRDVRRDLKSPELPFVIGVMGVGGPTAEYPEEQKRYQKVHQNFRDAMSAPAAMPEFKGNVKAVLTENSWDSKLASLRTRQASVDAKLRKARKESKLEGEALTALREKLFEEEFSPEERDELQKGVSNLEYHYLGSATILTQIGKGFAEAMHQLEPTTAAR
ncbi:sialate O-acetylesterase [Mariniblastus fucicola]|uniref:Sialate O-acetylesterase domain-containing protein n=1 Tax=Mariniblastus fucicola TaxID=980251 RepID=A0A5B9PCU1_9BACT|nr:sialate O-acetylesterase [Mariniblastus fucicola]QEG23329.1 hypothetical protein MFFC18_32260 [Mariniblastus fucicola]